VRTCTWWVNCRGPQLAAPFENTVLLYMLSEPEENQHILVSNFGLMEGFRV
jgi:hypothetical protein